MVNVHTGGYIRKLVAFSIAPSALSMVAACDRGPDESLPTSTAARSAAAIAADMLTSTSLFDLGESTTSGIADLSSMRRNSLAA